MGRPRVIRSRTRASGASPSSAASSAGSATSATSPAPSASSSSAVGAFTTLTTSSSGSATRVTPAGSAICPAVNCVPGSAPSTDTVNVFGDRQRLGFDLDGAGLLGDQGAVRSVAHHVDADLDDHLLAAADDQQIGMRDAAADRVDRERLGQCQLLFALDVEGQHRVGAGVPQHGGKVLPGQLQVLWISAVAVEHGRNPAFAPSPPGRAFAGLGPYRYGKLVRCSGHDVAPVSGFVARPGSRQSVGPRR